MKKSREEDRKTKKSTDNSQNHPASSAASGQATKTKITKPKKKKEKNDIKDYLSSQEQSLEKHFRQSLNLCDLAYSDIFPYFFEEINKRFDTEEEGNDILYTCPEISEDILPKREWQQKIMQDYIMVVLESDPIVASILLVRLLNSQSKADECFSIITRYLKNIVEHPENDRYRHIRYQNPIVISNVLETRGALMFLLIIGFEIDVENDEHTETFLSFNENHFHLTEVIKLINDVKGFQLIAFEDYAENDQKKSHTDSESSHEDEDYYKLTSKDLKKNQQLRALEIEKESQLRTKSTREKEKRRLPKSNVTKIRIRTPEGKLVESSFEISDKLIKVYDFIEENLSNGKKFTVLVPPATPFKETDKGRTLADLQLYPAVLLTLKWTQKEKLVTKGKKVKKSLSRKTFNQQHSPRLIDRAEMFHLQEKRHQSNALREEGLSTPQFSQHLAVGGPRETSQRKTNLSRYVSKDAEPQHLDIRRQLQHCTSITGNKIKMATGNAEKHPTCSSKKTINDIKGFKLKANQDAKRKEKHCRTVRDGSREDDYYKLTSQDLKKNQKLREQEIERESQLRTKEMREKEKRSLPKSKVTKIRIRIPNGKLFESTFEISDKLLKVYEFIDENISNGKKYTILVPPATPFNEIDKEKTLVELQLYPAVLLTLKWV
nr:uncharacterized protein LOC106682934 [Halyomorpha halys]